MQSRSRLLGELRTRSRSWCRGYALRRRERSRSFFARDSHGSMQIRMALLVQRLGLQRYVLFAGGFFLGVFLHPGFPAFSGGGVSSREGQGGDISVGDGDFLV